MTTHRDAARIEDGDAVRYRLPITEADFHRILSGHQALILRLLRYPPAIAMTLVPAADVRILPTDHQVHHVPLLIGPDVQAA